jgi:hypothetical protein
MARFHAALEEGVEAGSASPRVDWPVYPRRVEHNTVAEGGIADGLRLARQDPLLVSDRRQPDDHVAIALALAAQGAQPVNDADIQPDQPLAVGVDVGLVADVAQWQRGDDGVERRRRSRCGSSRITASGTSAAATRKP